MKRIILFGLLAAALWTAENWWLNTRQAELSARLAVNQFNGDGPAHQLRVFQALKDNIHIGTAALLVFAAVFLLGPLAPKLVERLSATRLGERLGKWLVRSELVTASAGIERE